MRERQFNRQWTIALVTAAILDRENSAYVLYQGKDSFVLPAVAPAAAAAAV